MVRSGKTGWPNLHRGVKELPGDCSKTWRTGTNVLHVATVFLLSVRETELEILRRDSREIVSYAMNSWRNWAFVRTRRREEIERRQGDAMYATAISLSVFRVDGPVPRCNGVSRRAGAFANRLLQKRRDDRNNFLAHGTVTSTTHHDFNRDLNRRFSS